MEVKSYVIGITGHRDLNESTSTQLAVKIQQFLDEIITLLPNTPIEIITGMADGADRILAKEAINKGLNIHAVLPMSEAEYKADFSDESWQDYQKILTNTLVRTTVLAVENIDNIKAQEQGSERNKYYHALAQYLVEQSNVIIAVWDGVNRGLKGGTGDVVLSFLGAKAIDDELTEQKVNYCTSETLTTDNSHVIYWLPVASEGNNHHQIDSSNSTACYLIGGLGSYTVKQELVMPEQLKLSMEQRDEYNGQVEKLSEQNKISSDYSLLNKYQGDSHDIAALKRLDNDFLRADAVALANQKQSDSQFKLFSFMAAAMGLFFLVYAKIVASKLLLIGYLTLFIFGWLFFKGTEKHKYFTKHLTARVLAETLRTQFYLKLINKNDADKVIKLMDVTGISQFSGASWIKELVKAHQSSKQEQSTSQQDYNMEFVCKNWLEDQANYFAVKAKKLTQYHHKLEKIKAILFSMSAIATLMLIFFKYQLVGITLFAHVDAKTFTVLLMGLLPFWLGVWEIYQNKMAIKELLWQYRNQSLVFNQAKQQLDNATTMAQKTEILTNLAEHSMMENYIWIIHRYHREHEPPTAG